MQKADREFTVSLLSLIRNFRKAIEMHEDLSHGTQNPAELMTGCYDGIKVMCPSLPTFVVIRFWDGCYVTKYSRNKCLLYRKETLLSYLFRYFYISLSTSMHLQVGWHEWWCFRNEPNKLKWFKHRPCVKPKRSLDLVV